MMRASAYHGFRKLVTGSVNRGQLCTVSLQVVHGNYSWTGSLTPPREPVYNKYLLGSVTMQDFRAEVVECSEPWGLLSPFENLVAKLTEP